MRLGGGGGEKLGGDFTWRRHSSVERTSEDAQPQATPTPLYYYCGLTIEPPSVLGSK